MAEPACSPGGGGAESEGLGCSRGGFTTKLHLSADGGLDGNVPERAPMAVQSSPWN